MKDYVLTLLVAAAVTYVLTPLVRRFAIAVGAIKQPRERDVHTEPVPSIGGLAMYGGLAAALFVANEISQLHDDAIAGTGMLTGLLGAGGLLVIIGFIDDRWGLSALTKAAGQVAAGGILVATGAEFAWLPWPGGSGRIFIPSPDEKALLTILIVVATINAVNFIDGLDGLAAGIVAIAATSFFAYYYSLTKLVDISSLAAPALASAVLIGMCVGFLPHNFAPAKIFMGDTGAMLLGLLLAYAPISSINTVPAAQLEYSINRYPVIMPLLLPVVLLVIPYGDMLLAVVRRTRAGQSPFAADRKHLHHRLLDIGHSMRASVLIMYLWAAAFSGTVVWLSIEKTELPKAPNHHGEPVIVFVVTTAVAVAILLLLSMPWRHWRERARAGAAAARAAATAGMRPAGRGTGPSGVTARSAGDLVATSSPTRSVVLSGSRPAQAPQGDGGEPVLDPEASPDVADGSGAGGWTGATSSGDGGSRDVGSGAGGWHDAGNGRGADARALGDSGGSRDREGGWHAAGSGAGGWHEAGSGAGGWHEADNGAGGWRYRDGGWRDAGSSGDGGWRDARSGDGGSREAGSGGGGWPDAGNGAGPGPWTGIGNGATADGDGAAGWPGESGPGDGRDGVPDDARPPDESPETPADDAWQGIPGGHGERDEDGGLTEFVTGERGWSAAGTVPPVVGGGDWAWFRSRAGSAPDSGRPRGEA